MKIKNNNGFTLLELLVSIVIFTIVIFLGYRIIDKSIISVKYQGNINKGQLAMNNMNKYLTKDIEQAIKVELDILIENNKLIEEPIEGKEDLSKLDNEYRKFINNNSLYKSMQYIYTIKVKNEINKSISMFNDKQILSKYIVSVEYKDNKYEYSVSRVDYSNTDIDFVKNEVIKESITPPFMIKSSNPYEVSIQYSGQNNKVVNHKFDVVSRYQVANNAEGDIPWEPIVPIPKPPDMGDILPPDGYGKHYAIGFWTADKDKCKKNNLYTWISSEGKLIEDDKGTQEFENNKFDIKGNARPGNNEDTNSYIDYISNRWSAKVEGVKIEDKSVNKVSIYVSSGTILEDIKIVNNHGNKTIRLPNNATSINGDETKGWVDCIIEGDNSSKVNFEITGKLSINKNKVSSGYAIVVYGQS